MSRPKQIALAALWVGSMFVAGMLGHAQAPLPSPEIRPGPSQAQAQPTVLSGNDIGFRIDSYRGATPVGRLVVRINGRWVEFEESLVARRLPFTSQ
jgi:hypothetical protein